MDMNQIDNDIALVEQVDRNSPGSSIGDKALIALLQQTLWNDGRRDKNEQAQWASEVISRGAVIQEDPSNNNEDKKGWCPVVRDLIPVGKKGAGKTAHIIPHKIGFETAGIMFGKPGR